MKNKKGAEGTTWKVVVMIMAVIVLVVIVAALLGLNFNDFFRNLPDFIQNWGKTPADLLEDATIYNIDVKILLNDGSGRCIVYETYKLGGEDDSWLKNYGIKGWALLAKDKGWDKINTGMDRLTRDMIENKELPKDLIEKEKELVGAVNEALKNAELCKKDPLERVNPPLIPQTVNSIGGIFAYSDGETNDICVWSEDKKDFFNLPDFVRKYIEDKGWELKLICDEQPTQRIAEGCILQSTENENYAFESGNLYVWYDYNTAVNLFGRILGSDYNGIWKKWEDPHFKNQIIKQDLYEECYLEDRDFKDTVILGKRVKLLLRDAEKRCIVYESPDYLPLELYGIKRSIDYVGPWRLNRLNEKGGWEDIDANDIDTKIKAELKIQC